MINAGKTIIIGNKYTLLKLVFLFLMCLNFMNKFYQLFIVFMTLSLLSGLKTRFSHKAFFRIVILALFAFFYLSAYKRNGSFEYSKIVVILSFMLMFIAGYSYNDESHNWKLPIWFCIFGFGLHGVLNFLTNINRINPNSRVSIDFWLKNDLIITGQIAFFITIASLSYYVLFMMHFKDGVIIKVISISFLFMGLIYNVLFSTRTIVYVSFISVFIGFIISIFKYKRNPQKVIKYLLCVFFIVLSVSMLFQLNIFGLKAWILNSPLYLRILRMRFVSHTNDIESRSYQIILAFKQILKYPFGNYTMQFPIKIDFIHNTWLNIAYGYGLIPCVLFFVFCCSMVFDSIKVLKKWENEKDIVFVICLYAGMLLYFSIEPVCEASPTIITFLCFLDGCVLNRIEFYDYRKRLLQNRKSPVFSPDSNALKFKSPRANRIA